MLQNLFFATLNTEIGQRGFSSENNATHRDFSRYRYRREIADRDGLLALFAKTPFINGGLFDCLDSFEATGSDGYRIDCFSDVHYAKVSIPNRLFFSGDEREPGLIDLFHRYKFTVEENTPAEQEVALDPELLGKVFENLLAAYNPETRENARPLPNLRPAAWPGHFHHNPSTPPTRPAAPRRCDAPGASVAAPSADVASGPGKVLPTSISFAHPTPVPARQPKQPPNPRPCNLTA